MICDMLSPHPSHFILLPETLVLSSGPPHSDSSPASSSAANPRPGSKTSLRATYITCTPTLKKLLTPLDQKELSTMPQLPPLKVPLELEVPAPIPKLPNWYDPQSIASYIVALASFLSGLLTYFNVTVPSGVSASIRAWAFVAGLIIAAAVIIVHVVTHRSAHTQQNWIMAEITMVIKRIDAEIKMTAMKQQPVAPIQPRTLNYPMGGPVIPEPPVVSDPTPSSPGGGVAEQPVAGS